MRRTRLAAAGAAAAIALGGTVAAASTTDTQTVTITVTAQELSVTADGDASISVVAGAAGSTATVGGSPTLDYTVPPSGGEASISAALTGIGASGEPNEDADWPFGELELGVALPAGDGTVGTDITTIARTETDTFRLSTGDLLTGIAENANESGQTVTYSLSGTAPATAVAATAVTITFTITQ